LKKNNRRNRWIMGSAIGVAAIAVAIDHTRHRLPVPAAAVSPQVGEDESAAVVIIVEEVADNPCGLEASPCSLDDSPCTMGDSPCSLDDS
jgi:hypothetical protein